MFFLKRWLQKGLDLDNDRVEPEELLTSDDPGEPDYSLRQFINTFLYLALREEGVAINFFHDHEDELLRTVIYLSEDTDRHTPNWLHVLPAPGYMAEQTLSFLRDRVGIKPSGLEGILRYCYQRQKCSAVCTAPNQHEVRIYFTKDRPRMRTKGIP